MDIEQIINEIEKERVALLAKFEKLEAVKRQLIAAFQSAKDSDKAAIEKQMRESEKEYASLQDDFEALADKLKKLKENFSKN